MRQTDELRSIARFINGTTVAFQPAAERPAIYMERPRTTFTRPAFKIDNPTSVRSQATNTFWFDERTWAITFFARNRLEAMRWGEGWLDKLMKNPATHGLIPLWIFDLPYYAPVLQEATVDPVTALGAGTYSVQVVAENLIGQITLASPVTSVAIGVGKGIKVQVPLEPKGWPIGKKFHIYLSGTGLGAAHRVGNVSFLGNYDPTFTIVVDVPGGTPSGAAPALLSAMPATSEVRYRYMRVLDDPQVENMEDTIEDKLWNHIVRLRTQTIGPREYTHDQLIGQVDATTFVIPL